MSEGFPATRERAEDAPDPGDEVLGQAVRAIGVVEPAQCPVRESHGATVTCNGTVYHSLWSTSRVPACSRTPLGGSGTR